jgi:hypothetical protein
MIYASKLTYEQDFKNSNLCSCWWSEEQETSKFNQRNIKKGNSKSQRFKKKSVQLHLQIMHQVFPSIFILLHVHL